MDGSSNGVKIILQPCSLAQPWHLRTLPFLPAPLSGVWSGKQTPLQLCNVIKGVTQELKAGQAEVKKAPSGRFRKAKLMFQPIVLAAGDPSEDARGLWGNSTPPPRAPTCLSVSRRGKQWPSPCSTCQISWRCSVTSRSQSGLRLRGAVRAVISKFYARRDREEGQRTGTALSTNELQRLRCV